MKEQAIYQDMFAEYNQTKTSDQKKRTGLLKKMLGDCGENVYIEAPFYANFGGHHCHFGNNIYVNYRIMREVNEHNKLYYYKNRKIPSDLLK